eukprot:766010-Hanusia_phi.AAC.2
MDGTMVWEDADSVRQKINALVAEGADINWSDDWGWTPIHCAVANGNYPAGLKQQERRRGKQGQGEQGLEREGGQEAGEGGQV